MSWLMKWITEDENKIYNVHVSWAKSWQEVMRNFLSWISPDSDVVKGKVVCYWDHELYGDGTPCLNYNSFPFKIDTVDEY